MKNLSFPEITCFQELFPEHRPHKSGRVYWPQVFLRPEQRSKNRDEGRIGEYCAITGRGTYESLSVRPTPAVVEQIRKDAVVGDAGPIFFKIIRRDDGSALVTWSYNSILGGRWLAVIDAKTIPAEGSSNV